ncbi:keratin-associated protein 10-6-like [Chrysoperla carnea]|uniref:keratin-associated protein 10-6-like n=1 Tax=Chrysoperla carnea TaxID=189513 RepID=UPI001D05FDF2|nr:keratin-associated protein 10-6-like [Chrysoperla carnea]
MNLSRKIRDSIAKYDNSDCAEVLFRKDCRPNCPPYGRNNCSDTCVAEDSCTFTPRYCRDPCADKYCDRVISECSLRSPTGSLHNMRYSAMNCSRLCRRPCPSPSPCSHNPYPRPIKLRYGPPDCPPRCSTFIEPCVNDRCCDSCDERFPRACDSIILSKNRISRTRRCGPRYPCRSPCGSPRCKKPPCNYRYPRNCVKPRVCCDGPPCTPSYRSPMRCPSPCSPRCDPSCDPCKPIRCASPCRPTKYCPKPPRCSPCSPEPSGPCGPGPSRPCSPCPPKRSTYCGPRSRCPPNCDSYKYPCFYYDKSCNNLCVKMVDGCAVPNSESNCCEPLPSLFCSGSGTMFSINPYGRDNCCGDYNYRINKLRSLSNIRSAIFNDCNDRCRPRRCTSPCPPGGSQCSSPCPPGGSACPPRGLSGGARGPCGPSAGVCEPCGPAGGACGPCRPGGGGCGPCGPGGSPCGPCGPSADTCGPWRSSGGRRPYGTSGNACMPCGPGNATCGPCEPGRGACGPCEPGGGTCAPCPPRTRPYRNDYYDPCKPCPPRRPCIRVKSLCFNDCYYGSRRPYLDSCGRPKTCPTPISPECNTSCKCSGCTMFGPSYCVQRSNSRVPCLCAKYPCLPKFC